MPVITCGGAPLPLFTVVEYLGPSKSNDLLRKFPDNSALENFNYAQSSIWSPLLPPPPPPFAPGGVSRKLTFDEEEQVGLLRNTKKIAGKIKRKFTDSVLHKVGRATKMKRRGRSSLRVSPAKVMEMKKSNLGFDCS
ncbi:hypothetical protein SASPL_113842 [Salvia splendens]|uniref:Uncharacterized protein n=1 Tax=Salvia splendens TaxID=180675 RepID=A0A8X9A0M8_SALSN|nr:hypothetical protein SASPL_113842 [Salvia splendens]